MADRSYHSTNPMDFHPCDTPRGMDYFDLACLTKEQQQRLNNHKIEVVRQHQKFLYRNPEIRAVIHVIMKKILLERPSHDVDRFIGNYFLHNWEAISEEVKKYVEMMPGKPSADESKIQIKEDKHVKLEEGLGSPGISRSRTSSAEEHLLGHIAKEIVDELVQKAAEQAGPVASHESADPAIKEDKRQSAKSEDEDDELIFDLGLDFDLDFSGYHEEDENKDLANKKLDKNIIATLSNVALQSPPF
ncbi:uncharacterized protein LOC109534693 [Dendroctonus ponderosae]|uniref:uncharacterized protein LOC109534693 n=1 Tax=Dendroctonus ponderosae TaxID=77166 RepID=UPI002034AD26|nr:uncharacterized protein LOC109534693 [Dendroctonus ponderosae]